MVHKENKQQVSGETRVKKKNKEEGGEKRSHGEGSKITEIKHRLEEREREMQRDELSPLCQRAGWMVLCKN